MQVETALRGLELKLPEKALAHLKPAKNCFPKYQDTLENPGMQPEAAPALQQQPSYLSFFPNNRPTEIRRDLSWKDAKTIVQKP
jgi:hypothetical protein